MSVPGILIGTILMDKNRWTKDKSPSFLVSDWTERFVEAGLDGMELWEFHATGNGKEEVERLAASKCPVSLFNVYFVMEDGEEERRHNCNRIIEKLGCRGVKFNVGKDPGHWDTYLQNLRTWRNELPADVTLLCECHPGTVLEEPSEAKRFFDEFGPEGWEIIVHPFSRFESLKEWFDLFGDKVTHTHLQMPVADDKSRNYSDWPDMLSEAMDIMRKAGFGGSHTLEFSEGIGAENEGQELLFESALRDLATLKQAL